MVCAGLQHSGLLVQQSILPSVRLDMEREGQRFRGQKKPLVEDTSPACQHSFCQTIFLRVT